MNGIIFQAGDRAYQPFFDITSPAAKKYAETVGCDYKIFLNEDKNFDRHIAWYKIFVLRDLLQEYDWAFLIDGDALVLNFNVDITKCLSTSHHIYACSDGNSLHYFNSGVMLFKSTSLTKHFIENVINTPHRRFYHDRNWEQNAMHAEIGENPTFYRDKIKIFPAHFFNHDSKLIFHPAFKESATNDEKLTMLKEKKATPDERKSIKDCPWIESLFT